MKEEYIKVIEASLDFYEALIREDYSFTGDDKTSMEEDVNLHSARHEFIEAVNSSDTLEAALDKIKAKTDKLKKNSARNVELGSVILNRNA